MYIMRRKTTLGELIFSFNFSHFSPFRMLHNSVKTVKLQSGI